MSIFSNCSILIITTSSVLINYDKLRFGVLVKLLSFDLLLPTNYVLPLHAHCIRVLYPTVSGLVLLYLRILGITSIVLKSLFLFSNVYA